MKNKRMRLTPSELCIILTTRKMRHNPHVKSDSRNTYRLSLTDQERAIIIASRDEILCENPAAMFVDQGDRYVFNHQGEFLLFSKREITHIRDFYANTEYDDNFISNTMGLSLAELKLLKKVFCITRSASTFRWLKCETISQK